MSTTNAFAPTDRQIAALLRLGVSAPPATRSEASKMIDQLIASRETAPATTAQKARASGLNGKDLPGAGLREKSTQIYLLEALAAFDSAESQEDINAAAEMIIQRVRERFAKAGIVVTEVAPAAPVEQPVANAAPAADAMPF